MQPIHSPALTVDTDPETLRLVAIVSAPYAGDEETALALYLADLDAELSDALSTWREVATC